MNLTNTEKRQVDALTEDVYSCERCDRLRATERVDGDQLCGQCSPYTAIGNAYQNATAEALVEAATRLLDDNARYYGPTAREYLLNARARREVVELRVIADAQREQAAALEADRNRNR